MSILDNASHVAILGGTHVAAAAGSTVNINQGNQARGSSALKDLSAAAAHTATHDSAARFDAPRCHQNTRARYLDSLELWMLGEGGEFEGKRLIWLNGGAGAGKSAIMQSIIERCSPHGVILGSFFFFRTDTSRNYAEVLIPTLAYQLARSFPAAMTVLESVIFRDPLIFKASLRTQVYELLVCPIRYLFENGILDNTSQIRRVFVVDGLDECSDPQKQALIIHEITSILCDHHLPINFVVASRPELAIASAFDRDKRLLPKFAPISLDDDDDAQSDIRQFVADSFLDILESHPWRHYVDLPWPHPDSIDALVRKSSGHFIYAATAMKYITSSKNHPTHALEIVEGLHSFRTESPFAQLDALYMHILTSAHYSKQVLGILRHCYLSNFASTIAEVSWVHNISPSEISLFLSDVQSLISVSFNDKSELSVIPKHASLFDFIRDKRRCQSLYISWDDYHTSFLERYFQLLDNALQVPAPPFQFSTNELVYHLATAICCSEDGNLLDVLLSHHTPEDIWNFCVTVYEFNPTLSNDARVYATESMSIYLCAIRDSITDNVIYTQQLQMYVRLVLYDIEGFLYQNPQYCMIPALLFSSGYSALSLAINLLDSWGHQFDIDESYSHRFWSALTGVTPDRVEPRSSKAKRSMQIDPRSFKAIRYMPHSHYSWRPALAITMKLMMRQLVHLSWFGPLDVYHSRRSPYGQWLRQSKGPKHMYRALATQSCSESLQVRTRWTVKEKPEYTSSPPRYMVLPLRYHRAIKQQRTKCLVLLKAVIYYLRKSDCSIEVVKLARRSLPKAAQWFPKLMRRARAEMDAYVRRWEDSTNGLLERARLLQIDDMD